MSTPEPPTPQMDAEPMVAPGRAPVWMFVLLALLMFWGLSYLEQRAGGFHAKVYEPYPSYHYVNSLQPRSAGDEILAEGQRVYMTYCSPCHQPTGLGLPGQFPPLAQSDWIVGLGPNRIVRIVLSGMQGPITVNGQNFNGAMTPHRDLLTDREVAAVVSYVRGNKAWGNNEAPITAEQVKAIRDETAARGNTAWTPDQVLQTPDK